MRLMNAMQASTSCRDEAPLCLRAVIEPMQRLGG
ncbi:hypothetical protein FHR47_000977 [Xanthomonas arboricola]|nr:hypothetical protein [Xanthomonas cannabis]